jgi:phospholipid-translocating ATPase
MIKKDVELKWRPLEKESFKNIKTAIANAPSLHSPDFSKYFLLYTFASEHSLAAILTQKDEQGDEYPIGFMSFRLQGVELNYPLVEKQ